MGVSKRGAVRMIVIVIAAAVAAAVVVRSATPVEASIEAREYGMDQRACPEIGADTSVHGVNDLFPPR